MMHWVMRVHRSNICSLVVSSRQPSLLPDAFVPLGYSTFVLCANSTFAFLQGWSIKSARRNTQGHFPTSGIVYSSIASTVVNSFLSCNPERYPSRCSEPSSTALEFSIDRNELVYNFESGVFRIKWLLAH